MEGSFLIGSRAVVRPQSFRAHDPATGVPLGPDFSIGTAADVAEACDLAAAAFDVFRETDPEARAGFLDLVADRIEALGDALVQRAMQESGLAEARLAGERGRTTGQLRMFARVLREGRWAGVTLDTPGASGRLRDGRVGDPRGGRRVRAARGRFSLLQEVSNDLGAAVVAHPAIKAVGFTESRAGGLALVRLAHARPEPRAVQTGTPLHLPRLVNDG